MDNELRAKAKTFYNVLDFDRPINFGLHELVEGALPESLYVPGIHGDADPVLELADQIDYSLRAGAYLFTGNRGTGKTTELMRLAKRLGELDCEVFYVDMAHYLTLTRHIEVTDFLIAMLGALSEKVSERFNTEVGKAGFFDRALSLLKSEVQFDGVSLPLEGVGLKAALRHAPVFREELQNRTRSKVHVFVRQARDFVFDLVELVRAERCDPHKKVVLLVDSLERLRGVGSLTQVRDVLRGFAQLFSSSADQLHFDGLSVVYTIPPWFRALVGGLGTLYDGIYSLPNVQVYQCRPLPGEPLRSSDAGLAKLADIVKCRYAHCGEFLSDSQLRQLAHSSGGHLRDFFRMLRLVVVSFSRMGLSTERVIESAKDAVRSDMLPIANDDRDWLSYIDCEHQPPLSSIDTVLELARLQQSQYVLSYCHGEEEWYGVHPLLREHLRLG